MSLRGLNLADEISPLPQEVKGADHNKPNFFSRPPNPTRDVSHDDGGNGLSAGIAIGLCFTLFALMVLCKSKARRGGSHSGHRSVHHRGNKKKVAPLPMPPQENEGNTRSNAVDEEQPPVNEENVGNATLPAIPE